MTLVLHVVTRFAGGGSERDITQLTNWERSHGFDVAVITGGRGTGAPPTEGVLHRTAAALVPEISPVADIQALRQIRSILRQLNPHIVMTHQSKAGVIGRLASRGVARATVHMVHMASFGPGYSRRASRIQAVAERYCARSTDKIVCVGEELRARYLDAGIGRPEQYTIIRTPIDITTFAASRDLSVPERTALRDSFGLRSDRPVVLAVGALEPRKRHALMIENLRPLLSNGAISLAFAGEGPEREALTAQVSALGLDRMVRFIGSTPRVPELFGCADVMLLTSLVEGVPRVLIEALAAGVPVVATEVEGLHEVPGAPITVLPRDGRGLVEAVGRLIRPPRPAAVPLSALEPWRPTVVDAQIGRLYEGLAAGSRPTSEVQTSAGVPDHLPRSGR